MNCFPNIKQAWGLLLYLILITLFWGVLEMIFEKLVVPINPALKGILDYAIPLLITVVIYLKKKGLKNQDDYFLRIKNLPISHYVFLVVLTILLGFVLHPLLDLLPPMPQWLIDALEKYIQNQNILIVLAVLLAPILEELIFRGIILDGFLKLYTPRKAIIWSSLLFAIFHLNPWQLPVALILGAFIGWVYYKTKSIWPCILIHFTNNLMAVVVSMCMDSDTGSYVDFFPNKFLYAIFWIVCAVLFYFGIKRLRIMFDKEKAVPTETRS